MATKREIPDSVGAEYLVGAPGLRLAKKYKSDWLHIRKKLISLGVQIRPRGLPKGYEQKRGRKVDENGRQEIAKLHTRGLTHPEIAKRFGITKERVRQIVALLGLPQRFPVVQKRARDRRKAKAKERAEIAKMRRGRIEAASELWKGGAHWTVIADVMNWKCDRAEAFQSHFGLLRKREGESAFPYRRPDHWSRKGRKRSRNVRR